MTVRRSRSTLAVLSFFLLFGLACAGARPAPDGAQGGAEDELEIARTKLRVAELELDLAQDAGDQERAHKAKELEIAQGELRAFDELDSPNRIARERLALKRSQDDLAEQEEELAQLEMTYAEVDLSDKTREIVLQRSHRRVERAKEELALAERELAKLEQHTLPFERAKLALAVDEKAHALENAQQTVEIELLGKNVAVAEARAALAKLEKKNGPQGKAP